MPNKAFQNLEENKRKKLLLAALEEFSKYPYDQISINRIIQSIDMPRGSFYLYFSDKEDLYLYIITKYHNILIDFLNESTKDSQNIIDIYEHLFTKIINYCDTGDYGSLLKMFFVGLNHNIENKLTSNITRIKTIEIITDFNTQALQKIRADVQIEDVIDILTSILFHSIAGYYIMHFDLKMVSRGFHNKLAIIKNGIYE